MNSIEPPKLTEAREAEAGRRMTTQSATLPAKAKFIKLDDDVAAVLRNQLEYDETRVRITGARLGPKLYKRVNQVLEQFGGKWKAGKVQAHEFPTSPKDAIAEVLDAGKVLNKKQTYQFFETPRQIATRVAELAELQTSKGGILEPSAGNGALISAIYRVDSLLGFGLDAVDIDPERCAFLHNNFLTLNVFNQDFLTFTSKTYDRILMNPPFTGGQDADHVMHAFELLTPGGLLVAIIGEGICTRTDKKAIAFQAFVQEHIVFEEKLPDGAFKESGTLSASRIIKLIKEGT